MDYVPNVNIKLHLSASNNLLFLFQFDFATNEYRPIIINISTESARQRDWRVQRARANSADFCIREPITLAYAREVGKILAYVSEEVIPNPEYYYYMW